MSVNRLSAPAEMSISLEDIDISQELLARPVYSLNRKAEIAAMYALADGISQGAALALKQLSNLAVELCHAGSAGVSVIESGDTGDVFRWRALAGVIEQYEGGSTPRDWSPCGECLKAGRAVLYSYPARFFTYFQKLDLPIVEGLVIPMYYGASPLGTIWVVSHTSTPRFNAEHVRIMTSLGSFAAGALQITVARGAGTDEGMAAKPAGESRVRRQIVWAEFVTRIARRDELALEALFEETHALVFSTALRILSFRVDAEEVAADVFARVWMTAGTFDARRGNVGAWLVTMARSGAIDRLRVRATRLRSEAALLFQCNSGEDPEATVDASQTKDHLKRALQSLPFAQRVAIELFYFSDLPAAEIAVKLGLPVGTVKTRLRLGLMKLRRMAAALENPRPKGRSIPCYSRMLSDVSTAAANRGA